MNTSGILVLVVAMLTGGQAYAQEWVADPDFVPASVLDDVIAIDVLANDSGPEGDSLRIERVYTSEQGRIITHNPDGTLTYHLKQDVFIGKDRFYYDLEAPGGDPVRGLVVVTITDPQLVFLRLTITNVGRGMNGQCTAAVSLWKGRDNVNDGVASSGLERGESKSDKISVAALADYLDDHKITATTLSEHHLRAYWFCGEDGAQSIAVTAVADFGGGHEIVLYDQRVVEADEPPVRLPLADPLQ